MTSLLVTAIIALVILSVLLLVLFIPTEAGIEFLLKDNVQKFHLHLKLFGFINMKIPLSTNDKKTQTNKHKTEETTEKNKKKLDIKEFIQIAKKIKEAYNENKVEIKETASELKTKTEFKDFNFEILFSTGNAASTGIMTGAAWTSLSILAKVIDEIFGINNVNINVIPTFNEKCFNMYLKSIFRLKVVNIIIILIKILKIINIFKTKISTNKEKAVL